MAKFAWRGREQMSRYAESTAMGPDERWIHGIIRKACAVTPHLVPLLRWPKVLLIVRPEFEAGRMRDG